MKINKDTDITFRLSNEEKIRIQEEAEKRNISTSQLIREAVQEYLNK